MECANNALQADWDRWKQSMRLDMKSAFGDVAENNIRYYEQVKGTFLKSMQFIVHFMSNFFFLMYCI